MLEHVLAHFIIQEPEEELHEYWNHSNALCAQLHYELSKKSYFESFFGGLVLKDIRILLANGGVLGKALGEVRETIANMKKSSRLLVVQAGEGAINQILEQEKDHIATSLHDLESPILEQQQKGKSIENHNEVSELELDISLDSKFKSCSSSCMIGEREIKDVELYLIHSMPTSVSPKLISSELHELGLVISVVDRSVARLKWILMSMLKFRRVFLFPFHLCPLGCTC